MGINRAEQSIEIPAPSQACFDAIVDFETYPEWQNAVISTEVLDRYQSGLGKNVRLTVDARLRKVTYVLLYHYDAPRRLWWDFVEGDGVAFIDGEYLFVPGDTGTLATYKLGVDAGLPVPGPIARKLNEVVMRRSVEDLKREVERRQAAPGRGAEEAAPGKPPRTRSGGGGARLRHG
jgi:Polyketide cyclase / dehydrase and lipid transport